jgi:branched-chain amino acid transport system ATP-binding protein
MGELFQRVREGGVTLLLIEHDVKLVMGLCDRVAVLDYGRKIAEGDAASVQRDAAVIAAYLGGSPA